MVLSSSDRVEVLTIRYPMRRPKRSPKERFLGIAAVKQCGLHTFEHRLPWNVIARIAPRKNIHFNTMESRGRFTYSPATSPDKNS